jgi:hypothetical protein
VDTPKVFEISETYHNVPTFPRLSHLNPDLLDLQTNGWTSGTAANESIFISRADPFYTTGTYAVGVQGYGKGSSQYQLLVQFTSQNRTLIAAQRTVLQTIFNTCCNSSVQSNGACSTWLDAGGLDKEPCEYPNWECSIDGQLEVM